MKPIFFYSGMTIVVGTHIWMLVDVMPESIQKNHATLNLIGAGLIFYGSE
jgi:hypothetical protein